jgi:hypothetical protein
LKALDISKVEFSPRDRKMNINIPQHLTRDLVKLDGVIRSDGSVMYKKGDHHNDVSIFGHSDDDRLFFLYYVIPLIKKVHGDVPVKIHKYPSSGQCLKIEVHSKAVASFWNKIMKIQDEIGWNKNYLL